MPKKDKAAEEIAGTLDNEFNNSDWEFDGSSVESAVSHKNLVRVRLADGREYVLAVVEG